MRAKENITKPLVEIKPSKLNNDKLGKRKYASTDGMEEDLESMGEPKKNECKKKCTREKGDKL